MRAFMVRKGEKNAGTKIVPLTFNFRKSLTFFVTLSGHKRQKNGGYKTFCDHKSNSTNVFFDLRHSMVTNVKKTEGTIFFFK